MPCHTVLRDSALFVATDRTITKPLDLICREGQKNRPYGYQTARSYLSTKDDSIYFIDSALALRR